jgi:hypothetical protein
VTRRPLDALLVALLDCAIGIALVAVALRHAPERYVLAHFVVYAVVIFAFKARTGARRVSALVVAARSPRDDLSPGPGWLRVMRLLVGYDTWSRTERFGLIAIAVFVCALFGWDDGGPFAAALFVSVGAVDLLLAATAFAASRR